MKGRVGRKKGVPRSNQRTHEMGTYKEKQEVWRVLGQDSLTKANGSEQF